MNDWKDFKMAFRHPFGPHAQEPPEDILRRKKRETEENGWTLWSFRSKGLEIWHQELVAANPPSVFVFCGTWKSTRDPGAPGKRNTKRCCTRYKLIGPNETWQPVPPAIEVPHPFRPGGYEASAFVVERVEYPIRLFSPPSVEWFYEKKRIWKNGIEGRPGVMLPYPTMGEYLIRPGGTHRMQHISAVLKLKPPYLAYVVVDD